MFLILTGSVFNKLYNSSNHSEQFPMKHELEYNNFDTIKRI